MGFSRERWLVIIRPYILTLLSSFPPQRMIFEACQDDREAVFQQELLLYLAPLIVSSPEMFASVLRMRLGYGDVAFYSIF